jgi:hypothetical protein
MHKGSKGTGRFLILLRTALPESGSVCRLGQVPTCPFINLNLLYTTSIIPYDCRDPSRISLVRGNPLRPNFSSPPLDSPAIAHKTECLFLSFTCRRQAWPSFRGFSRQYGDPILSVGMRLVVDIHELADRGVGVLLRGGERLVAKQLLNGAQVSAVGQQMRRKGVAQ